MSIAVIDNFPVADLYDRYSVKSSSTLYARLGKLGIKPHSIDGKAFITSAELAQMDESNNQKQRTGRLAKSDLAPIDNTPIVEVLTDIIHGYMQPVNPVQSLRERLETLTLAAQNGWHLSSSEVSLLIGIRPYGKIYKRCGFIFTQVAKHREAEWRVSR
jgi:hypothetical protein